MATFFIQPFLHYGRRMLKVAYTTLTLFSNSSPKTSAYQQTK